MYDEFYGLTGRPFQLTPDPRFYFESGTHRKALSYLGYGLTQGEGFIVITGEIGAGKSTLAAHLMAIVDHQRLTAARIVTSALDGEELIHVSARAFGLEVAGHDKATALAQLEAFLHHEAREGRRCLLVVDESQSLSVEALEELRMLSNFQLGSHPLLQILLLGQPEFRTFLQTSSELEQLRQRVIASHHLEAMEPSEIGAYIEHRLACVGWKGNPSFDARVYADLAKATGGIPRRVNQIVNRLLLMAAVEQRQSIDAALLHAVIADLAGDGGLNAKPAVTPVPANEAPVVDLPTGQQFAAQPTPAPVVFDDSAWRAALAERDEQIAELQQAIIELADMRPAVAAEPVADAAIFAQLEEANRRIAALEAHTAEQEQAIRHVLSMLIEWIETEDYQRAAA